MEGSGYDGKQGLEAAVRSGGDDWRQWQQGLGDGGKQSWRQRQALDVAASSIKNTTVPKWYHPKRKPKDTPRGTRTRSLEIRSLARYHCASGASPIIVPKIEYVVKVVVALVEIS